MKSALSVILLSLLATGFAQDDDAGDEDFQCPESNGYFAHDRSCDKYWKCEEGVSKLKTCGNGLAFDDGDPKHQRENCDYMFAVTCGDRTELEPAVGTDHCTRLYGIFPDEADCRVFWSCWNGDAKRYECAPGLAFDQSNRVCVWADQVKGCNQKEVAEGFACPDPNAEESAGAFSRHPHPDDCRKFFVCLDNTPRMYGCSLGTVFNIDTVQCDEPENVPGCEKYYGDLDIKGLKKAQEQGVAFN